jgi:hypothetical protein
MAVKASEKTDVCWFCADIGWGKTKAQRSEELCDDCRALNRGFRLWLRSICSSLPPLDDE